MVVVVTAAKIELEANKIKTTAALNECLVFIFLPLKKNANDKTSFPQSIISYQLPAKSWISLPFENPPDIFRAVGRFVHEVPAGIEEYFCACYGGIRMI